MESRRMTDPHLEEIKSTLGTHQQLIEKNFQLAEKNSEVMERIEGALRSHVEDENEALNDLKDTIQPMVDVWVEMSATGKFLNRLKKASIVIASIGAAIVAIWTGIVHGLDYFIHIGSK